MIKLKNIFETFLINEGSFKPNHVEATKAGKWLANRTFVSATIASKILSAAVHKKQIVSVSIHTTLEVLGFTEESLQIIANKINSEKLKIAYKDISSKGSTKTGIESFSAIAYRFNKMYKKAGSEYKYMKILNHLGKHKFADLEDLIYVYNGFDRKSVDIYTQKDPDKLLSNVKGVLIQLGSVGLIEPLGHEEITTGRRFWDYMSFVNSRENELGIKWN